MSMSNTAPNNLHTKSVKWQRLMWIDIEEPTLSDIEQLKQNYHFHDLELDDCLRRMARPLIETHEEYIFMMLHFPVFHKQTRVIVPSQVSVFLGRDYLITLHEGDLEPLIQMFKNCELNQNARMEFMARSSAHLLYHLLDHLVNYSFTILNGVGDSIERMQEYVFRREIRETGAKGCIPIAS